MRLIGLIGSGATTTYAPLIIYENMEYYAREESLVVISDDKRGKRYIGVIRSLKRYEPFLIPYQRTSYVDNPELASSGTLPFSSAYVSIIGVLSPEGKVMSVEVPPNPGSKVYVVTSPNDIHLDLGKGLEIGVHKFSKIPIPVSTEVLPYHMAVVGATGTGKSRLVKAIIDEILAKTNYSVIVFDHTGLDYVKYYPENTINASDMVLDVSLITDLILNRTALNTRTYEQYILCSILKYLYEYYSDMKIDGEKTLLNLLLDFDKKVSWNLFLDKLDYTKLLEIMAKYPVTWDRARFKRIALSTIKSMRGHEGTQIRVSTLVDLKLGDSFFESLNGRHILPKHVVEKALEKKLVVIDLSTEEIMARRYIVSGVIREVWRIIEERKEPINMTIVIDEAHNYACHTCGEAKYAISRVAREGRKWGFGLILATQRIIDIDPEIRSNINTWFFSKLQTPGDYEQLRSFINLGGIREETLAVLEKREFFLAGLGNPLKIPILIEVKKVE